MTTDVRDYCPWLVRADGIEGVYRNITHPLQEAIGVIEDNGVLVDKDKLLFLSTVYGEKIEEQQQDFWEKAGVMVEVSKPQQLQKLLYEDLKLPILKTTKKGAPSTAIGTLERLASYHECVPVLIELKKSIQIKKNFLTGMPGAKSKGLLPFIDDDGRIRTNYRVDGTDSGRLSSFNPNTQNIARNKDIRSMFIPREGYAMIEADYSQLELRIISILSNDPVMKEGFRRGDLHKATAMRIFNVIEEEVTKAQRDTAKTINFGIAYGMAAMALSFRLGITVEEAEEYIDTWFRVHREVNRWMRMIRASTLRDGYQDNVFGRRRHLSALKVGQQPTYDPKWPGKKGHLLRVAVNFPIQSTGSDLLSLSTSSLISYPIDDFVHTGAIPNMSLHDALFFEAPLETAKEAAAIIKETMEAIPLLLLGEDWILPADVKIGTCWGDNSISHPKTDEE